MTKLLPIKNKSFAQLNKQELYSILQLRIQVFCVEQNCPYQDIDGLDQISQHFYIADGDKIIAYARVIPPQDNVCHIGRVVVAEDFRDNKLASKIMQSCIKYCQNHYCHSIIAISAQSYLRDFYHKLGFTSMGKHYLEDDIPHELMQISPEKSMHT
ncbi:MAG: GNAT family N-acetyltransferase [Proteobacteria bacterium]|nr:GNAT family N-acetyltransferase [Pseudomonadota bacterium]